MTSATGPDKASYPILIVDDSPTQAQQLCYLLEENQYRVLLAKDGKEALALVNTDKPAIIISDIIMPEMNGLELCKHIKDDDHTKDIPVVLLTSLSNSEDVLDALDSGADSFLTKPYDDEYLLGHLERLLSNRSPSNDMHMRVTMTTDFGGRERCLNVNPQQMLTLLFSTYEAAVHRNAELRQTQDALQTLNMHLEDLVEARTEALQTEISERKRAEESLRASEAKLRGILDNIGIGICLINKNMHVLEMNRTMHDWFPNVNLDDCPVCYRVFNNPSNDKICKDCPTARTLRTGITSEGQIKLEGHKQTYRIVASAIIDTQGEVDTAIEMVDDITERLSLEDQLHQAQKMEAIGQLAGGVAHDFNNILQAMVGYSSLLLDRLEKGDERYEFADEIAQGAARAAALTRQLLAFSRRQILEMEDLELNEVIQGVMKMLRRVIGENIEVGLIEGRRLGIVHADPGQMEQVLINLCVNARDAMPEGGRITIETENVMIDKEYCDTHTWAKLGHYVLLSVTDTGCGMDAQTQAHIFEPFFTTKELGKGTGLGLATVYGIVRQHNGMIQVYSEVDKGSTFKIYIPSIERPATAVEPRVARRAQGGTETILVAEDDENLRKLTSRILMNAGYTVILAVNGQDALDVFQQHAADIALVMLDVIMPKMGGKAVYDTLQEQYPHLRFLFTSGYSTNAIHTGFILHQGIELIQKPFAPDALLRKVREILDHPMDKN